MGGDKLFDSEQVQFRILCLEFYKHSCPDYENDLYAVFKIPETEPWGIELGSAANIIEGDIREVEKYLSKWVDETDFDSCDTAFDNYRIRFAKTVVDFVSTDCVVLEIAIDELCVSQLRAQDWFKTAMKQVCEGIIHLEGV